VSNRKTVDPLDLAPRETIQCGTCGEREATHEISVRARRGFDYQTAKQIFSVEYAVCEQCARDLVTVKLGAELRASRSR
jgi:hypothetical protein